MAFSHRLTLIYTDWGFYAYLSERLKMSLTLLFGVDTLQATLHRTTTAASTCLVRATTRSWATRSRAIMHQTTPSESCFFRATTCSPTITAQTTPSASGCLLRATIRSWTTPLRITAAASTWSIRATTTSSRTTPLHITTRYVFSYQIRYQAP